MRGATPAIVRLLAAAAFALALTCTAVSAAGGPPQLGGCSIFPASSSWNERVDTLPVAADSATLIASIG